jgi:hypothetical protein
MAHLCQLTMPGLDVRSEWRLVHDRLLDDFPAVTDVLATTMPGTLLIVHQGRPEDAWLDSASAALLYWRGRARAASRAGA